MSAPRHSWSQPNRVSPQRTERICWNDCGIMRVTRHEGRDWIEFWRADRRVSVGKTPPCEPGHPNITTQSPAGGSPADHGAMTHEPARAWGQI